MASDPIAVVIPYYQRQPGVLRRALASVANQVGVERLSVLVVDDESPVPSQPEVDDVQWPPTIHVSVLKQSNGGPGAARNRALDNLPQNTRYVAFLDSDDEWSPDHLTNALRALGYGRDVYFTDVYHVNQAVSAFVRAGRIRLSDYPLLESGCDFLHAYTGLMVDQIATGNLICTPSVVYDVSKFRSLRFRSEFLNAGEDYLFWMDLAQQGARFAFSSKPEVKCGVGVNVYSGSGWGTPEHFKRLHDEMKYRKASLRDFALSPEAAQHVRGKIVELRVALVSDLLHRLKRRQPLDASLLLRQFRMDPLTYLAVFPFVLRKIFG